MHNYEKLNIYNDSLELAKVLFPIFGRFQMLTQLIILNESKQAKPMKVADFIDSCRVLNKMIQVFMQKQGNK